MPENTHLPVNDEDEELDEPEESDADYLRGLAERIRLIPVMYGVDGGDITRLYELAWKL